MFDRFQIVLGHYVFYMLWHGGQGCPFYERMCRIERYFTPGHLALNLFSEGNEFALEVYKGLCVKHDVKDEED